jgi:hypothetical protein
MHLRRISAAIGVACVSLLVSASLARAAAPASVTVRVEGGAQTLLPSTQVTTNTTPVVKDGKPEDGCPGTNAIGALEVATAGNWSGRWFGGETKNEKFVGLGYSWETILGEAHAFGSGAFWEFWQDHRESAHGICEAELETGDELLFFPCPETAKECLTLSVEAPSTANVGEGITVTVKRYSTSGAPTPQAGATVTYEGAQTTTNESGQATFALMRTGTITIGASAPEVVRAEATVCVHNGNDGTCGTHAPGQTSNAPEPQGEGAKAPYRGPFAVISRMTNVIDGHVYSRRRAPRLLDGEVIAHTGVVSAGLELRRSYRGRCWAFDGVVTEFRRAPCGHGSFFVVAHRASFSYLLPAALGPGRYVLDSEATDSAGNHTTLARGTTRIVFYVR